jgi:hypothetical protein
VLRFQGYKRGAEPPTADVRAIFDDALARGREFMLPRATVRWLALSGRRGDMLETALGVLTIPGIADHWGEIAWLGVAVCTIGDRLEAEVSRLWEARELPLAAMLDSVGSAAVESLAEYVNDALCAEGLAAGVRVTNRVSPGYGAWDVRDQRAVFGMCPGDAVGVQLNDACVMTPAKSITLLVGAGVAARVDHYFSQCARCWMATCAYRRVPARRTVHR